eukprot:CAMPEP_0117002788 /NCGR_PEP_ID=MMETSP0472-20121206/4331_1 /TAXON_ID=693140 ORGANISM="Tiarina fusus, Strain LIS" /NCGR_SAMPLE_ID=MMETSP0472 /ASSEMBLY_ACC=CAM_ASM_000603 /LENGTH=297 /DNA_ID=CAMNT_0004703233 /DNA_START=73 /DNA_END=967 /DNA_ORIENTATION=+
MASAAGQFYPNKLTSEVFNTENPPKDWADVGLLIPHETIRHQQHHMLKSVGRLAELVDQKTLQPWQVLYFCEWYVDIFEPFIHHHHESEERLYFPWLQTKAEIPDKRFSKSHEDLLDLLTKIGDICGKVIQKKGVGCENEVGELRAAILIYVPEMNSHLAEEERDIPDLARKHFTEAEETAIVEKILQSYSLGDTRNTIPFLVADMRVWASPEYVEGFIGNMPGPLQGLLKDYWIPDFETSIKPKRDAPFLGTEPSLTKKGVVESHSVSHASFKELMQPNFACCNDAVMGEWRDFFQ